MKVGDVVMFKKANRADLPGIYKITSIVKNSANLKGYQTTAETNLNALTLITDPEDIVYFVKEKLLGKYEGY